MPSLLESMGKPFGLVDCDSIRSTIAVTFPDRGTLSPTGYWRVYEQEATDQPKVSIDLPETPSAPAWVVDTIEKIASKLALDPDWDSYGASPVSPEAVVQAIELLLDIVSEGTTVPWVVPTSSGGIQLEWHTDDDDLEVEVNGAGKGLIYWRNRKDNEEWEDDLVTNTDRLRSLLARFR